MKTTLSLLILLGGISTLAAQNPPFKEGLAAPTSVVKSPAYFPFDLKVQPQAPPTPRMKYPLQYDFREQVHGNAALSYHRAMAFLSERRDDLKKVYEKQEKLYQMLEKPFAQQTSAPLWEHVHQFTTIIREIETGALRDHCDWDLESRLDEHGIGVLLPEVQKMREFASILKFRCRANLIDGKLDDALHDIRVGYSLARHVGNGPTLIQALVGIAIFAIFTGELDILLQQPGAPNLYWSLTALPVPFIDLRKGIEGEVRSTDGTLTMWKDLEKGIMTKEQANKALASFTGGQWALFADNPNDAKIRMNEITIASYIALQYPNARKSLISMGRLEAEVNAMPPSQVVMLEGKLRYKNLQDEMFVWFGLPMPEAYKGLQLAEDKLKKIMAEDNQLDIFGARLMGLLMPAVAKVHNASSRTERRIAALRIEEAIRWYAAEHGGALPKSLADITEVPLPNDPLTGKPFFYEVENGTAKLFAMPVDGSEPHIGNSVRYLITIRK